MLKNHVANILLFLRAFWQHKIDIKDFLRAGVSQIWGKIFKFEDKFDIFFTDLRIFC